MFWELMMWPPLARSAATSPFQPTGLVGEVHPNIAMFIDNLHHARKSGVV